MWWIIGIAVWLMVLLVIVALCRAAGEADHVAAREARKTPESVKDRSDRAA